MTTRPSATGQRSTLKAIPQPAASASVEPATSRMAASTVATPAVSISAAAVAYLRAGGRSRSTP